MLLRYSLQLCYCSQSYNCTACYGVQLKHSIGGTKLRKYDHHSLTVGLWTALPLVPSLVCLCRLPPAGHPPGLGRGQQPHDPAGLPDVAAAAAERLLAVPPQHLHELLAEGAHEAVDDEAAGGVQRKDEVVQVAENNK